MTSSFSAAESLVPTSITGVMYGPGLSGAELQASHIARKEDIDLTFTPPQN